MGRGMLNNIPYLGVGLGYRKELRKGILANRDQIDLLELIADQYINMPPIRLRDAQELSRQFPIALHGVDLSIGTDFPIDREYLNALHHISKTIKPHWVSDHLCFTRTPELSLGQLTPLPFNEDTVKAVVKKIKLVASAFDCPFLIENISYIFSVPLSTMTEAEFISQIVDKSKCWLLLDLTNLYNNAQNHNYDPYEFLDQIPLDRVIQLHLAGGSYIGNLLIDTHSHPVHLEVFRLLSYAAPKMSNLKGVIIERDQNFPEIIELLDELKQIRGLLSETLQSH